MRIGAGLRLAAQPVPHPRHLGKVARNVARGGDGAAQFRSKDLP